MSAKELVDRIGKRKQFTGKNADPLSVIMCGKDDQAANFHSIVQEANSSPNNAKRYNNNVPFGQPPELINENPFAKTA